MLYCIRHSDNHEPIHFLFNHQKNKRMSEVSKTETPGTQIPLATAQERALRFRQTILGLPDYPANTSQTKACLIYKDDIEGLISEGPFDGIRCYLGLRFDDELNQQVISLMMVRTELQDDGTYKDIINETDPTNSGIFDFTAPCPNTCSPTSPLNII